MTKSKEDEYTFEDAREEHAWSIAGRMMPADAAELWAAGHKRPLNALLEAIQVSDEAYTALYRGMPFSMFGISPATSLGRIGIPWLLSSVQLDTHAKQLIRWSSKVAHHWLDKYPIQINMVDNRHKKALRWAKWVGFQVYDPEPYGPDNMDFCRIELRRD